MCSALLHTPYLAGQDVGWDQRRFAAPAHQQFSMFHDGGPALEASWSHPTLKLGRAVLGHSAGMVKRRNDPNRRCLVRLAGVGILNFLGVESPREYTGIV